MFQFFKKPSKSTQTEAAPTVKPQLPEGCEVLDDCDFAEVSGGVAIDDRPVNL